MSAFEGLTTIKMNEERFMSLITKLVGEAKTLQNNPSQGLIPREDNASDHLLEVLLPLSTQNGGPLVVERVSFVEGRGNLIVKYPGTTDKIMSFIGSHLDVVPAAADGWDRDPFTLQREGDLIFGRGTTDCLGHVAVLTDLFCSLAENKPSLKTSVVAVFIANEENGLFKGVGIDQLAKEHYLDDLKKGPVFWVDAADSQPCLGTAGNITWKMEAHGKLFHSGMPHRTINSVEMAMDAVIYLQNKFYEKFPRDKREVEYNFATSSTLKPTQVECTPGSLNQTPPLTTYQGDVRLSPFYDVHVCKKFIEDHVAAINADPTILGETHGPHSKYTLPGDDAKARIVWKWLSEGENGIACHIDSPGYHALIAATKNVLGDVKPYSIGGSLPLVRAMQDEGFDVQIAGYGFSARYHADNECASISALGKATEIFVQIISLLE